MSTSPNDRPEIETHADVPPVAFAETDLPRLHAFIEQHSFGLLVSQVEGLPFVSHLPLVLDRTAAPHGTLVGHMARANPQWQQFAGQTALAVFSGPPFNYPQLWSGFWREFGVT